MRAREDIIRSLLCSATTGHDPDCAGCPYVLPREFGGHTWDGCDCDRMARDAAEMLRRDGNEQREKICDVLRGKIAAFRRQRRATEDYSGILTRGMNYRPMSNGDRIRRMSDEELATEIIRRWRSEMEDGKLEDISWRWCDMQGGCVSSKGFHRPCTDNRLFACVLRWLRAPAKEKSEK